MTTAQDSPNQKPRQYVIVGGTSGMGHAAAANLSSNGDHIALVGRQKERAEAIAERLPGRPGIGEGCDEGDLAAAVVRAIKQLGGIDGLAVTAGPINSRAAFLDLTDDDWAESFDTHLMTMVRSVRAVLPAMIAQGSGSIVTIAAYSIRAQKRVLPHYAAMKSAIVSATKNIAKHYGSTGIRANCVAPGAFATEALDGAREQFAAGDAKPDDAGLWAAMRDQWGMANALDRIGQPQEAGELIAFLLSDKAAYLTGALINIDGGTDF